MTTPAFAAPRFVGERFEQHTLPLSNVSDLLAYQALLIDVAKHLYIQAHPERQRVPKGFADVHLDISGIEAGSTKAMLQLVPAVTIAAASQLSLLDDDHDEMKYFLEARDVIAECVASSPGSLPDKFPKGMLAHFNRLGRSLKEGETLVFESANDKENARLTPAKRRELVLAAGKQQYEKEIELSGYIAEADWQKSSFRLHLDDGLPINVPMPEDFHDKARASGGKRRDRVFIQCIAVCDSKDSPRKILSVESIEVIRNYDVAILFEELEQLQNGWLDGEGKAPDKSLLQKITALMVENFHENLPLPAVVPTPEGNLLLEWQTPGTPSVDIELATMQAYFHAFDDSGGDIERDFSLSDSTQVSDFFAFLSTHVQEQLA